MPRLSFTDEQVGYLKNLVAVSMDQMEQQAQALKSIPSDMLSDTGRKQINALDGYMTLAEETMEALNRKQGQRAKRATDAEGVADGC